MYMNPWETIANYESHELLRLRHGAKHGGDGPNSTRSRTIAASFIQARHYFQSAKGADRSVKPLLLYYGVLSLSRGLVLFLTPKPQPESLSKSHGLVVNEWDRVLSTDNPDIGAIDIKVTKSGSFLELLEATENRNILRDGTGVILRAKLEMVRADTTFSLDELLSRLPDVMNQYQRWRTCENRPHVLAKCTLGDRGPVNMTFCVSYGRDVGSQYLKEHFGDANGRIQYFESGHLNLFAKPSDVTPRLSDRVIDLDLGLGELFMVEDYPDGTRLAKSAQLFAISYILGMLVRYYPGGWMNLIQQRIGDAGLPTILRAIDLIEDLFPKIVVDFLEE